MKRHKRVGNLVARQAAFERVNSKSGIIPGSFTKPGSENRHKGCGPGSMSRRSERNRKK